MKNKLLTIAALAVLGFLLWQDAVMALLSIGTALLLILPFLRWYEPRLIYYPNIPTRLHQQTPNEAGFAFEDVHLTAQDGTKLHGWYVPVQKANSPTVLLLHGNAGNISHRIERLTIFRELGAHLMMLDYRGYGISEGAPYEAGTYLDAIAAYDFLIEQKDVAPERLVIYGESLGTAVAVDLATKKPCGGVVLEAPFTSIADMAQRMFPILPVRRLVRNRYDSLGKIAQIEAPILIFHSRADEVIPIRHAERLVAAAAHGKLVELQGGHSDMFLVSPQHYMQAMRRFLGDLD
jgi:fermentation-respiration switch protein FrsA (DUF1100 family)